MNSGDDVPLLLSSRDWNTSELLPLERERPAPAQGHAGLEDQSAIGKLRRAADQVLRGQLSPEMSDLCWWYFSRCSPEYR